MQAEAYQRTAEQVLRELGVNPEEGLSEAEVKLRRERFGNNELAEGSRRHPGLVFLDRFKDPLALLLLLAGLVSFLLGRFADTIIILMALLIDAILSYSQIWKAEKTLRQLKEIVQPTVSVIREGREIRIAAQELTVGDIVELQSGERVPADIRIVRAQGLRIQESVLTGESDDVEKQINQLRIRVPVSSRSNMAYLGTVIVNGSGLGVVVAGGTRTEMGKISQVLKIEVSPPSPLRRKLQRASMVIGAGVISVSTVLFIGGLLSGKNVVGTALTALTLMVSTIPEDLTMILTISLTIGVRRILKHGAAVRSLESGEGLGAATVICTDKTGTLTEGSMQAEAFDFLQGTSLKQNMWGTAIIKRESMARLAGIGLALASDAHAVGSGIFRTHVGTATERAALQFTEKLGFNQEDLRKQWRQRGAITFNPQWKFRATLHDHPAQAGQLIFAVGAPDILLDRSTSILNRKFERRSITSPIRFEREKQLHLLASQGYRLVGVAVRRINGLSGLQHSDIQDLIFLGILTISDPIRAEVPAVIRSTLSAGIGIKLVTGDHPETTKAIARKIGLPSGEILTSDDMTLMSDDELAEAVDSTYIFARITPLDKQRIIKALQKRGHIVAMTGDGINDAVALKAADIGVAMGSGKDLAKQAADLILLDDRIGSMVSAVREGRVLRDNLRKVISFLLSTNSAEVAIFAASLIAGLPLPLLPSQILWINVVTDGTSDIALSFESAEENVMLRRPDNPKAPLIGAEMITHILFIGFSVTSGAMGLYWFLWHYSGLEITYVRTMLFSFVSTVSLLSVWSFRSLTKTIGAQTLFGNKWIPLSLLLSASLHIAAVYSPFLQTIFETVSLGVYDWTVIMIAALLTVIIIDLRKVVLKKIWLQRRKTSELKGRPLLANF